MCTTIRSLGEIYFGSARGLNDFLFVAVGTGVGGTLFLDGRLYRRAGYSAGRIGHITLDSGPDASVCGCGRRGCLEAFAAGPAIAARYHRLAAAQGLLTDTQSASLEESAACLDEMSPHGELVRKAVAYGADALGRGLGIAATLLDPQRIILGGGVSRPTGHTLAAGRAR
jgi:glucokinase